MVSVIWKKRALPVYWQILSKRGSSNFREQQAVIRPVLRLLKNYELVVIGDREFHSVHLAYWLKKRKVYFAFRQKQNTHLKRQKTSYQKFRDLGLVPGRKLFFVGVEIAKEKGFGVFNVAAYWKRKYQGKQEKEPWYILNQPTFLK